MSRPSIASQRRKWIPRDTDPFPTARRGPMENRHHLRQRHPSWSSVHGVRPFPHIPGRLSYKKDRSTHGPFPAAKNRVPFPLPKKRPSLAILLRRFGSRICNPTHPKHPSKTHQAPHPKNPKIVIIEKKRQARPPNQPSSASPPQLPT